MRAVRVGLFFVVASWGCAGESGAPATFVVIDSAGVEIVESSAAVWGSDEGWAIGEEPTVRIGAVDGEDPYRFYRITAATRLADGRIAVADAGSGQVRIFGADGGHALTLGSQGDGPGEFRSIRSLAVRGDSVMVFDDQLTRVTVYRVSGAFVTTWSVGMASGAIPMAMAELRFEGDGRAFGVDAMNIAGGSPPSLVRDTAYVFELRDGTPTPTPVAAVPGSWTEYLDMGGRPSFGHQALTSQPSWDVRGGAIYTSAGDAYEFRVYGDDGVLRRIARRAQVASALSPSDAQAWKDLMLERVPEAQRPMMAPMLDAFTMPAQLPVYSRLIVDADGNTWLGRFASPGAAPPTEWDVYGPDGGFLGVVKSPPGLQVMEIGTDYVLGRWTDALDVEYVQVNPLQRRFAG